MDALKKEEIYTIDDIYALSDGEWAELIDGQIYYMSQPSRTHQKLSMLLSNEISEYIKRSKGNHEVYAAPFAVFLNTDDINYVEPDISVICDLTKLDDKGCHGAPDWVIKIICWRKYLEINSMCMKDFLVWQGGLLFSISSHYF